MRGIILIAACGFAGLPAKPQAADVVLLTEKRPIILRLHILIDGRPSDEVYRESWDAYLKALFAHLDRDGDGKLSEAEGQRLPPPTSMGAMNQRASNLAFNFRVVDTSGDGKIDLSEAAAYYRDYGSAGIGLTMPAPTPPVAAPVNDALFNLLDGDKDGKLTRDELARAAVAMNQDVDEDELLTPGEFGPRRDAVNPAMMRRPLTTQARPDRTLTTFNVLMPGQVGDALRSKIVARYGNTPINWDRPDAELRIRLGKLDANESTVELVKFNDATVEVRNTSAGQVIRVLESATVVELLVNVGRPLPVERLRQQILDQYRAADVGRKGHVTAKDAGLRGFFPAQFPLLDRDLDDKLTEAEVVDYLDRIQALQARAVTCAVAVLGSETSLGLFDLLDENRDGRLSGPELRSAPRLIELAGGKVSLARTDLPRAHRLAIGLSQASFDRATGRGAFTPRGLPMLTLDGSPAELVWFHKMDRNRDGSILPREFLGPTATFRKLDADGDGLLTAHEAMRR